MRVVPGFRDIQDNEKVWPEEAYQNGCGTFLSQHPYACRRCTEERWHRRSGVGIARGTATRGPLDVCGVVACEQPCCYASKAVYLPSTPARLSWGRPLAPALARQLARSV
jgi:hypothetical protein